ncbi:hypothetical protein Pint_22802 [Pistacia integerrima]|uniref:Uncharacterized protein n=1 Tax=Pistacia integerrima TaxID=434235 RepID=A0ACC0YIY5_9ROSI|nr:hypothetical protein Pint_22802 [Pistacia integerrima]
MSITNSTTLLRAHNIATTTSPHNHHTKLLLPVTRALSSPQECQNVTNRRKIVTTLLATSLALGVQGVGIGTGIPLALAENWGTRSFIRERFFEPGLSPEDAVARIKQTTEGLHSMREMLDRMAWGYVIKYIRLKSAYLSQDLKNAMTTLPQGARKEYVKTANELVDNIAEFDYYVRTPKVYESYLYYEKTLKNLDAIVAMFT